MSDRAFKTILFLALLAVFCATTALLLLSLVNKVHIDEEYKHWMFSILIVESVGCVVAFWKQLAASTFEEPPDVAGDWEYECIRDDGTYKHGGSCTIVVRKAPLGWEFLISGKRTWLARKLNGQWKTERLEAPASWENTWGTFTGHDSLRYAYSIKAGADLVQGYGWASITKNTDGQPALMEGNFFQLPPHDPFYGFQRYTRSSGHRRLNAS